MNSSLSILVGAFLLDVKKEAKRCHDGVANSLNFKIEGMYVVKDF